MNDIQRELAEALRSGEAGQTPIPSNLLSTGNNRFSFSGLACEIYRRHHSQEGSWVLSGRNRAFRFEERDHHTRMPEKIARWIGLLDAQGNVQKKAGDLKTNGKWEIRSLSGIYEYGTDFPEMADLIEERAQDIFGN